MAHNIFHFEYGSMGDDFGTSIFDQYEQGTIGDDFTYQPITAEGYDSGVPTDVAGFDQFVPEGLSFSLTEGFGNFLDYDYEGYSPETDLLSGLSQEELAYQMGLLGFEHLGDNELQAAGGIENLAQIFANQYGGVFGEYDSTGLNLQGDVSESQQQAYYDAFEAWESGAVNELNLSLEQFGQDYLTEEYNRKRQYKQDLTNMNASRENYVRQQIQKTKKSSSQSGRSGLSGGSLSRASDTMKESIANQLQNLSSQRSRASQQYSASTEMAENMYQVGSQNLVSGFQNTQSAQMQNLEDQVSGLQSQFELTAGQSISDWYNNLIAQVSNLDVLGPDITSSMDGETLPPIDWSPFGLGPIDPDEDEGGE